MIDESGGDAWIVRRDGLIESGLGDEMVGLHVDSGLFFGFNATALRVWQLIEQPRRLSALCAALGNEYAVDPVTCEADVRRILADMESNGLVTLS